MNTLALLLAAVLAASASGTGSPPRWARVDPTYTLDGQGFVATDGGKSQSDHYLLSEASVGDFVLSWEMTRRGPVPEKDRALVCWSVDAADQGNRKCIFLAGLIEGVGKAHHCRLVVRDGEAHFFVGGARVGGVTPYGEPPAVGRVGFLHYYRYDYAYRNVRLVSLEGAAVPKPPVPTARVTLAGLVELRWKEPDDLAGLFRYAVERDTTAAFARPVRLGTAGSSPFVDRTAASGRGYHYRLRTLLSGGAPGPVSAGTLATVKTARPPSAPAGLRAVRRIDGSVRLAWELPEESRAAWVAVRAGAKETRLPWTARRFLDPAPGAESYTVVVGDPDGKRPSKASARPEPSLPLVSASARFPQGHPRLAITPAELAKLKAISGDGPARAFVKSLLQRADGLLARPVALPETGDTKHYGVSRDIHDLALAALVSGRTDYADHAKAILFAYVEKYPGWKWNNRRCRTMTQSPLYEALWAVPLVQGYDLLLGTGRVTPEERRRVEKEFLPLVVANFKIDDFEGDSRVADLHYRCYNFQAWHLAVTGLVGLLLGDADLVEWTLDSPYGFRHLLAHDIRDDGLFWERSLGYHSFVLNALTNLTEAAWRCNLNLYAVQAADRVGRDEDSNYEVDGDNGPKSLALMYAAPFFFVFPDLSYANVADSGRGPLSAAYEWRVAARRLPNARLDWLLARADRPAASPWRGPEDISGRVALAYDDQHLYVQAWVTDDVVRNAHTVPSDAWAGDLVWLALGSGSGSGYDYIYGLTPGVPGKQPPLAIQFNRPGSSEARLSAGRIAVSPVPGPPPGYFLEAAIPLEELGLKPQPGMKVAGEICLYDGDRASGASVKEKMVGWNCRVNRYDLAEGGTFHFGAGASRERVLAVPRRSVVVDGKPDSAPPADAVSLGDAGHVMTDATATPGLGTLLLELEGATGRAGIRPPQASPTLGELGGADSRPDFRFCNNGRFAWGSSLFPSSGFAILRASEALPWQQPAGTLCVNLNYGPYGGGHGHPDKLSLVLYALGRQWIPDFGSCGYDSPLKGQWTAQTVSHNTMVVDGVSQYPTGDRDVAWPVDSDKRKAMGHLRFFHSDPMLRAAGAFCDAAYEGVHLERTVALAGDYCADLYQVASREKHTYDYVLHVDGEPGSLPGLAPAEGALGEKCGYQHVDHLRRGSTSEAWEGAWKAKEGRLRIRLLAGGPTEVITGQSLTTAPERTMPLLIARREAAETTFATVLAPEAGGASRQYEPIALEGEGIALRAWNSSERDVLVVSQGKAWRASGMESDARVMLSRVRGDGRGVSLAACTRFRGDGLALSSAKPADLHLSRSGQGEWRVLNSGPAAGEVTISGKRLRLAPGETKTIR